MGITKIRPLPSQTILRASCKRIRAACVQGSNGICKALSGTKMIPSPHKLEVYVMWTLAIQ